MRNTMMTLAMLAGSAATHANADDASVAFWLIVLHNHDGESQLIHAGSDLQDFGGVARFATLVENLRADAPGSSAAEDNQDGNLDMFDVTSFIMAHEADGIDG